MIQNLAIILAMPDRRHFEIIFDDAVSTHFAAIERKDRSAVYEDCTFG